MNLKHLMIVILMVVGAMLYLFSPSSLLQPAAGEMGLKGSQRFTSEKMVEEHSSSSGAIAEATTALAFLPDEETDTHDGRSPQSLFEAQQLFFDESFKLSPTDAFVCNGNASAPLVLERTKKGKRRYRRYDQNCAQRAPRTAAPSPNSSYIFVDSHLVSKMLHKGSDWLLAVCISGKMRKVSAVGWSINENLLGANKRAHAYAATWPIPEDSGVTMAEMEFPVSVLRRQYQSLIAVRVEQFHPALRSRKHFSDGNAVFMLYLIEACARLPFSSPFRYRFYMRARFDLSVGVPLQVQFPVPDLSPQTVNLTSAARNNSSWMLVVASQLKTIIPRDHLVFHHYSKCCVNDWFAVGPESAMIPFSFAYSYVRNTNLQDLLGPVCFAGEACLQHALLLSGIQWKVAGLQLRLGSAGDSMRNHHSGICLGASVCNYTDF